MSLAIAHETSRSRFVAVVEGQECVIDYHLSGSTMTITHTIVPPPIAGTRCMLRLPISAQIPCTI